MGYLNSPEGKLISKLQIWFDTDFRLAYKRQQTFHESGASKELVEKVQAIVDMMPDKYKKLLDWRYIRGLNDSQAMDQLGHPESTYYRIKREALLEFAKTIEGTDLMNGGNDESTSTQKE